MRGDIEDEHKKIVDAEICKCGDVRSNDYDGCHHNSFDDVEEPIDLGRLCEIVRDQKGELGHLGAVCCTNPETCKETKEVELMDLITEE